MYYIYIIYIPYICIYIYIYIIYDNQVVDHNPCISLFILPNSFDNLESEIIFSTYFFFHLFTFRHTTFCENFLHEYLYMKLYT